MSNKHCCYLVLPTVISFNGNGSTLKFQWMEKNFTKKRYSPDSSYTLLSEIVSGI